MTRLLKKARGHLLCQSKMLSTLRKICIDLKVVKWTEKILKCSTKLKIKEFITAEGMNFIENRPQKCRPSMNLSVSKSFFRRFLLIFGSTKAAANGDIIG